MSDNEKLLALVCSRLYADDDYRLDYIKTTPPEDVAKHAYSLAKQRARDGDLAPLRKILIVRMDDPEIAEFIAQPTPKPWPKHVRKDYASYKPFLDYGKRTRGETVRRIREIIKQETGKARVPHALLVEIAAEILRLPPGNIRELIKRG